jgi:hypothetical protein
MDIDQEKRMAGDYEIIHALHIGDREIVLGENPSAPEDERYVCAFCQQHEIFANYTEVMVSDDYPELVNLFGERVAEQSEKTRIALNGPKIQGIPNSAITAENCEQVSYQEDIRGKVVVIRPEVLRREYRHATCQLQLCTSGSGAYPNSRGTACYCTELYSPGRGRGLSAATFSASSPRRTCPNGQSITWSCDRLKRNETLVTGRAADMGSRMNAGYLITDSIHIGTTEFVLGVSIAERSMFVTWACQGSDYYYWGHYHSDLLAAKKDLLERAGAELEYQMTKQERSGEQPEKSGKERERE